MTELTAGMEAPDFTLESDAGTPVSLSALRGNGAVLLNTQGKRFCDELGTRACAACCLTEGELYGG